MVQENLSSIVPETPDEVYVMTKGEYIGVAHFESNGVTVRVLPVWKSKEKAAKNATDEYAGYEPTKHSWDSAWDLAKSEGLWGVAWVDGPRDGLFFNV